MQFLDGFTCFHFFLIVQYIRFFVHFLLCSFGGASLDGFCTCSSSCSLTVSLSNSRFSPCVFCGNALRIACTYTQNKHSIKQIYQMVLTIVNIYSPLQRQPSKRIQIVDVLPQHRLVDRVNAPKWRRYLFHEHPYSCDPKPSPIECMHLK